MGKKVKGAGKWGLFTH